MNNGRFVCKYLHMLVEKLETSNTTAIKQEEQE